MKKRKTPEDGIIMNPKLDAEVSAPAKGANLFGECLINRKIPKASKNATNTLIHKKRIKKYLKSNLSSH